MLRASSERVLIVSNRLPISIRQHGGALVIERSIGGLATGLSDVHAESAGQWIGWPGISSDNLSSDERHSLDRTLATESLLPVHMDRAELKAYYEDFCNGVLWPLFHYLIGQLPLEVQGFPLYAAMNRRFAEAIVAAYQPGDLIWIHDYQLMLVPALVRERLPHAAIGFFLHIPFPSSDVFRTLPFREQILKGLLGADLIGFHTAAYMRNFASALLHTLGLTTEVDRVRGGGPGRTRLGVFPMGVHAQSFAALAESDGVQAQAQALRGPGDTQLLVGIDRLDYTKGIPRRLLAFERLLTRHPELRGRVRLIQVAVPSRSDVDAYQGFRAQVDGLIGRIHGAFATPSWVPVHYIHRGLPHDEVVALYRAADVLLVTPLRDGMNLVAKEFVASRTDEDGVLVLSEFAGAASELAEAIFVNPYDVSGSAEAYYAALTMARPERRTRMAALRRRVMLHHVYRWAGSFLGSLTDQVAARPLQKSVPPAEADEVLLLLQRAPRLCLVLDYDGTLVPLAPTPALASPDPELPALLLALSQRPGTAVHIVSGRSRDDLMAWLGHLPLTLHAEHGLWTRPPGGIGRLNQGIPPMPWRDAVLSILREYADRTPGSLVEEKPAGLAWHYRMADPEFGLHQANELRLHLTSLLSNTPVALLPGDRVVEIRLHGVHKGRVIERLGPLPAGTLLAAFGDDSTDEDLFAALPLGALSVRVGAGETGAALRLADVATLRHILRRLADGAPSR